MAQDGRVRTSWKARGAALVYLAVVALWVGDDLLDFAQADPTFEQVPWKSMVALFPSSVLVDALPSDAPRLLGGLMLLQPVVVLLVCWAVDRRSARKPRTAPD